MMNQAAVHTAIMTDDEVIEKVLAGDRSVFEILIRRYNAVLYKIGRTYGLNHQDTEDLMQDAHVAAFVQLKQFENRSSYKTWLSRIMVNKCLYKLKYGYSKNEIPVDQTPENDHINGERNLLNRELSIILEKSLEQLPVIYRSVFVLREVEGFSVADTAELLNITPVNVKVRLNRARTLMQKQLEHFYSHADIYSFNLIYCDELTKKTLQAICRVSD